VNSAKLPIIIFIFLVFLTVACGKHKAQVQIPVTPKPSELPAPRTETRQKPVQPAIPQESVPEEVPQAVGPEQTVIPADEFSPGPLIRIGLLTDAKEARVSSSGGFYVSERIPEATPKLVQGEIQVRVEQESGEKVPVYRIQVAAFTKPDLAAKLKDRLSELYDQPVVIRENPSAGLSLVRIGEFQSREEAQSFLKTIAQSGYSDAFLVQDTVAAEGTDKTVLVLRGPEKLLLSGTAGFLLRPSARTSFLKVNGKPYRGAFEISLNKNSRITLVNQIGTEEYLLSVVPAEISPSSYPEFTALEAMAIAARTYALHNIGKYRADGFDLTDDTRTQVYAGVAGEKDVTSDAVHQTAGLAIYYQGQLIDAMYMSTCGGRTEDFANVFDSAPVPYLTSVFCAIESGPEKGETVLQGRHDLQQIMLADDGGIANRNLEFARALGIAGTGQEMTPEYLEKPAEREEIVHWVGNAGKIAQRTQITSVPDLRTRSGFLQYGAETFFGAAEMGRTISPRDVEYYMGNLKDGASVPDSARVAVAYLLQSKLWRPYADNTVRPIDPIRRGDALNLLLRWVESARPEILRKGFFVSGNSTKTEAGLGSISVKWGNRTQEFRFSSNPYLYRLETGRTIPVSALKVIGNEKISFHLSSQGTIDFLEIELSPTGASSDRYSPVATWETTLSRSTIGEKLRGMAGNIGDFRDLKPYRLGNSGRAVQIQVTGSRGSVVLNGYKVRNALSFRDTLFSIDREYNPDGSISTFTFHGRGWGHGVGLCQVGAFGMARAGRGYEEIIKTYYQGVQIRKAY
jgi:stage II sporulation protein D